MTTKELEFGDAAMSRILSGVNVLADAVRVTLGPRGRNVVVDRPFTGPLITKDGASVAEAIELPDRFENIGAQALKEAARRTAEVTGDGSTTAIVLAHAIIREGLKSVILGLDPMGLKRGIERATQVALDALSAIATPCDSPSMLVSVGTVSANGDSALAKLLADALIQVGKNGVITLEEGKSLVDEVQRTEGMQFDRGYLSPRFINDPERQLATLEHAYLLIHEKKISSAEDLLPLLEQVASSGRPLLILAEDIEGTALEILLTNNQRGGLKSCAVKAPGFGEQRKALLEDIAVLSGATVITEETGMTLSKVSLDQLGQADRVEVSKDCTLLVDSSGAPAAVQARVHELNAQLDTTHSSFERDQLKTRIGRLVGGVTVLSIGAATELEMKTRKAAADDALHAMRAAMDGGVVPGGGVALLRACSSVSRLVGANQDQTAGIRIVRRALEEPLRQIAANAGAHPPVVVNGVLAGEADYGFDAAKGEFANLAARGIIDPATVVRAALQNATAVAGLLLTTGCAITESVERIDSART